MPGCNLYVSPDITHPLVNSGGTAAWSVFIPNVPTLVGQAFYNQALVLDPAANSLGATVSNAGEGKIGLR